MAALLAGEAQRTPKKQIATKSSTGCRTSSRVVGEPSAVSSSTVPQKNFRPDLAAGHS